MRETKIEIRFFSVPAWRKEENYLREQHKQGWKFVCLDGFFLYHFVRCKPQDVIYQLDYNKDSVEQREEYVQLFRDCGWEYMQNYFGYSYFRKPASEVDGKEEEIFSDDASRLDMMKRVFFGRLTPLLCVFFLVIIPQIIMQIQSVTTHGYGLLIFFCAAFFVYLGLFLSFAVQFWRYYKSIYKS